MALKIIIFIKRLKNKTDAMPCERFVFQARAVCEWSHRWQTGSTKYVEWLLLAARGWRDFCFFFFAKGMTAPQPGAMSRRA